MVSCFARVALVLAALAPLIEPATAAPLVNSAFDLIEDSYADQNISIRALQVSSSLQACLENTTVELVYPSSSSFSTLDVQQNAALPERMPAVFALPKQEAGVAAVVKCVAAEGGKQKISSRSGGHSYTGYNLGGADGWVVVDLKNLDSIKIDSTAKQATVGSGNRLGPMAATLAKAGFALPHGTCPSVGTGGHSLGGGYGFTSFSWGYLLDRIASMRLVKPDGSIVTVSTTENSDLYYALRGAGSNNFGIVTSFTYNLLTAPSHVVNFEKTFATNSDCVQAMLALQNITATSGPQGWDKSLGGQLLLSGEKASAGSACSFLGMYIGSKADYKKAMSKFNSALSHRGVAPTKTVANDFTTWQSALEDIMGDLEVTTYSPEPYYAKSLTTPISVRYDETSAASLLAALDETADYGPSISLDLLGPNSYSNSVPASSSALVHRDLLWISQYYSYAYPKTDEGGGQNKVHSAFDKLIATAKAVDPSASWGGYYNYVDAQLLSQDWGRFYWGDAVGKLKKIKASVDPNNLFDFPMAINRAG